MPAFLQEDLLSLQQPALARVLLAVAAAVRAVSEYLRDGDKVSVSDTKSSNAFGDVQSNEDLRTDEIFKQHLRICSDVETVATEETPNCFHSGGSGFSVVLDPLDGSSVMSANFAVGSIVGIWPGGELVGRTGRGAILMSSFITIRISPDRRLWPAEQAAACYAVYGPRTVLVVATAGGRVKEYALRRGVWERSRCDVRVAPEGTHVAPANARAAADNAPYRELLHTLLDEKATIRYSGALVADVHHALTAGQGLFVCVPPPPPHTFLIANRR